MSPVKTTPDPPFPLQLLPSFLPFTATLLRMVDEFPTGHFPAHCSLAPTRLVFLYRVDVASTRKPSLLPPARPRS